MKARGKCVKTYTKFLDLNCSISASQLSCNKHPHSSSVGICPHCLNDRLMKLVCSDCGEHRVSSCFCSEISSSHRYSCSNVDVGSVGRVSFLIDNDKIDRKQRSFLRRSSSNCVEAKESNGFWRIKKLFPKRINKGRGENLEVSDQNSEISSCLGENSYKQYGSSNVYEARKSEFGDIFYDENGLKRVGRNGWSTQFEVDGVCSVFPIKERDFSAMDEKGFIELKLDSSCESKQGFCAGRSSKASDDVAGYRNENFEILENLKRNGICGNGGSCRITMNERGLKQGRGNYKVWKWIFKYRAAANEDK